MPELGEIYPLGGSGDRLGLVDPDTGECLPAAMLSYCGRTLLEGLIRDLQVSNFCCFKSTVVVALETISNRYCDLRMKFVLVSVIFFCHYSMFLLFTLL